ncbi:oligosaccharyl transferase subunit ost3/OST6 [Savitreella phatthalungensis]
MQVRLLIASLLTACLGTVSAKMTLKKDSNGITTITNNNYKDFVPAKRDYWAVVLFTTLADQFGCHFCQLFEPEFKILSSSARSSFAKDGLAPVHFGYADFDAARNAFAANKLANAPNLWVFPPTDGPHALEEAEPRRYDFSRGPNADAAAEFLRDALGGRQLQVKRSFDYAKAGRFAGSIVGIVVGGAVIWRLAGPILTSRHFWALVTIALILIFNGGYMFTQVRHSPYKGGPDGPYIAGGFTEQFGAEVYIVGGIYGLLAFSVISLAVAVPRIRNRNTQAMLVSVWVLVQFFVYSFLIQLFRQKNGGYPFKLFL